MCTVLFTDAAGQTDPVPIAGTSTEAGLPLQAVKRPGLF